MVVPQFENREELEEYLSSANEPESESSIGRRLLIFVPMALAALSIGLVLVFYFPSEPPSHQQQGERWESMMTRVGIYTEDYKREQREQLEEIQNARVEIEPFDWLQELRPNYAP